MLEQKKLEEIQQKKEQWEENTLHPTLDRFPEKRAEFISTSSDPINRLYTPLDIKNSGFE